MLSSILFNLCQPHPWLFDTCQMLQTDLGAKRLCLKILRANRLHCPHCLPESLMQRRYFITSSTTHKILYTNKILVNPFPLLPPAYNSFFIEKVAAIRCEFSVKPTSPKGSHPTASSQPFLLLLAHIYSQKRRCLNSYGTARLHTHWTPSKPTTCKQQLPPSPQWSLIWSTLPSSPALFHPHSERLRCGLYTLPQSNSSGKLSSGLTSPIAVKNQRMVLKQITKFLFRNLYLDPNPILIQEKILHRNGTGVNPNLRQDWNFSLEHKQLSRWFSQSIHSSQQWHQHWHPFAFSNQSSLKSWNHDGWAADFFCVFLLAFFISFLLFCL